ncbi:2-isopropylmalate synthase [Acrocarpospora catenulata]|uniref:2-isopropylmalate synthase n=1 Tax=Acrocarpospora catenulata TaxID=2836182 RepID=UPI001BD9A579|nr:2-isopropylmalate synthase [Acrocarpospora catenulata]
MDTTRYTPFPAVGLPGRRWPDRAIQAAPRWLSTDLRDGNQSLVNPMDPARKLVMFDLLVRMGYKEIEVGFPVASQDDHDFVRMLVERDLIPDDVRITVMTPARDELLRRTLESVRGAARATVHLYNATAPFFRDVVFGMTRDECRDLAVQGTRLMLKYAERSLEGCDLSFQYSPELFNETELDFALEVCESVMDVWEPGPAREIILNFPTTVERSTPNLFADQIEWLDRNLTRREHVCLSIHPHNDRGTGVATAELALLAGAQRVEGCLFGNGERAGNLDLVTLGMNMYSQGVDPGIDFSDITAIRQVVEHCNELPVHPRHPYAGDLVYTAFSGAHQDAIRKGFHARARAAEQAGADPRELPWTIPYLPIDPQDIGRTYEEIVRITSQSGKGGVAYLMSSCHGIDLPEAMRADFARVVQAATDAAGGELPAEDLGRLFEREYLARVAPLGPLVPVTLYLQGARLDARTGDDVHTLGGSLAALNIDVRMIHRAGVAGSDRVMAYAECVVGGRPVWGAGRDRDVIGASCAAVRSALARA